MDAARSFTCEDKVVARREAAAGREGETEGERAGEGEGGRGNERDERGDYYLASAFQGALTSVIFLGQATKR